MVVRGGQQATAGGIFALVRDGHASSRADLARLTGLAPSTITLRVDELLRHGYLTETGDGASRGGRRPRMLSVAADGRAVAGVDVGATHATVVIYDLAGARIDGRRIDLDITDAPETVLRAIHREAQAMVRAAAGAESDAAGVGSRTLAGIGLALPGPVSWPAGRVTSPSRMPGWNGVDPAAVLAGLAGVPVRADNDANAVAIGEFIGAGRVHRDMIVVKAGSSIGTGLIADGSLYRGFRGMAGDVSHTAVADAINVLCSCGRFGCLDAVAGGRSIVTALRGAGVDVSDVSGIAALARDAHPLATRLLREAGLRTGAVLATLVSFANPQRVVLAGALSSAEVFVAGVRSSIYDLCLPLSTTGLDLVESEVGPEVGARGAAALVADDLLDPDAVDRAVRQHA